MARSGVAAEAETEVNDVHSQLNHTRVARIVRPRSREDLRATLLEALREGLAVSVSGSRHSMGGQQFGTDMLLLDTHGINRVICFDPEEERIPAIENGFFSALSAMLLSSGVPDC
jgi:FAD/FMN-containing dehydrogenase